MRRRQPRALTIGIFATLLLLLAGTGTQAAVWAGAWDPQFGAPFVDSLGPPPNGTFAYDLGWGGKVKVNDDTCSVPVGGGTISNDGACGNGAFIVPGSLLVTLYAFPNTTPVLKTLTFNAASLNIVDLRYDTAGTLTGFRTGQFGSDWVPDDAAGTSADFSIAFVLDGDPCLGCDAEQPFEDQLLPETYDGPVLYARIFFGEICIAAPCGFFEFYRSDVESYPAQIGFVQVPEPGSLVLIALGMLAAGAGARRRLVTLGKQTM